MGQLTTIPRKPRWMFVRGTNRMPDDRPIITGVVGVKPRFELPIPQTLGPRRILTGAGTQQEELGTDRFSF